MPEYNAFNERFKKLYEDALLHGAYRQTRTVDAVWKSLNLFEKFTGKKDFISFDKEQAKGFKRWLAKQENKKQEPLSLSTLRSILANVREFFKWLATHPKCIHKVDGQAVMYLRLSDNEERAGRATRELAVPTLAEIRAALEAMPVDSAVEKRDRAILAFTALTGVRDGAIISLKIGDVDIVKKEVWQDPRHVKTKNRKGIITDFMTFDPLWEAITAEWIDYAKNELGMKENDPLFPKQKIECNKETMKFVAIGLSTEHWANAGPVCQIFRKSFERVGLPYYNPHSFRKMLVIWVIENCNQYMVKAISQNLGHEHTMTTYNSYGTISRRDQRKAIQNISISNKDLRDIPDNELLEEMQRRFKR